ncbi:UNVERIFIED_CONTAM: hypothetical protein Sindi_0073700 [Sesamum indicum]
MGTSLCVRMLFAKHEVIPWKFGYGAIRAMETMMMFGVCKCSDRTMISKYCEDNSSTMDGWMRLKHKSYDVEVEKNIFKPKGACIGELQLALPCSKALNEHSLRGMWGLSKAGSRYLNGVFKIPKMYGNRTGNIGQGRPILGTKVAKKFYMSARLPRGE